MRKMFQYILAVAVVVLLNSCERRPLIELSDNKFRIEFEYEKHIVNDTITELPEVMNVLFFHSSTNNFESSHFVEQEGGEVHMTPSVYNILTYNFNTESTIVNNNKDYSSIEATTNEISKYLVEKVKHAIQTRQNIWENNLKTKGEIPEIIMNEPDHLFTAVKEGIKLEPATYGIQTVKLETSTIVERWLVEIGGIKGAEYLTEASMVVSGVVPSVNLSTGEKSDEKVSLLVDLKISKEKGSLYGGFNTFGIHPLDELEPQLVTFVLVDKQGNQHHHHYKLTDKIISYNEQKISFTDDITIDPPKDGGGFVPEVNEWVSIETNIQI